MSKFWQMVWYLRVYEDIMVQKNEGDYDCKGYYFVIYKLFSSESVKGFKCGVMLE